MDPILSTPIVVSQWLVGCKKAVKMNGTLYVSPAIYDLLSHASSEELNHLLTHIHFVDIGQTFGLHDALPMTTALPAARGQQ